MSKDLELLRAELEKHQRSSPRYPQYNNPDGSENKDYRGLMEKYNEWNNKRWELERRINDLVRREENKVFAEMHVPKGLARKLALHGFNEKCYRSFYKRHGGLKNLSRYPGRNYHKDEKLEGGSDLREDPYELYAPTYDQVMQWFTDKYDVDFIMSPELGREKRYRCDPVSSELGLMNLPFCRTPKEAQLQAFDFLLTKVKPLSMKVVEPEKDEDEREDDLETIEREVSESISS